MGHFLRNSHIPSVEVTVVTPERYLLLSLYLTHHHTHQIYFSSPHVKIALDILSSVSLREVRLLGAKTILVLCIIQHRVHC